jgi:hypothetical protein
MKTDVKKQMVFIRAVLNTAGIYSHTRYMCPLRNARNFYKERS